MVKPRVHPAIRMHHEHVTKRVNERSTVRAVVRGSMYKFSGFSVWTNEERGIVHVGLPGLQDATYDIDIDDIDALDIDGNLLVQGGKMIIDRASFT